MYEHDGVFYEDYSNEANSLFDHAEFQHNTVVDPIYITDSKTGATIELWLKYIPQIRLKDESNGKDL